MPRRIATVDAVKRAYVCPVAVPALERVRLMVGVGSDSSVVVGEIARQLAVGVGLGKEVPSLLLDNPPRRLASREVVEIRGGLPGWKSP
jgi:hypothetical protein